MKAFFLFIYLISFSFYCKGQEDLIKSSLHKAQLIIFGRGLYPGDDTTFQLLKQSGFHTVILSSFYIHADGDLYSGDSPQPIIYKGQWVGDSSYVRRVRDLKRNSNVTRIEILLEGRWYGQPPNTFDFIHDWYDPFKKVPGIITGIDEQSTLYQIFKLLKTVLGVDAFCIDDESVYDAPSVIVMGRLAGNLNMHMTLCPYTQSSYWKEILQASNTNVVDALYLQCYDGGVKNEIKDWVKELKPIQPVYPIFMVRGSFNTCNSFKGSKSIVEIKKRINEFKKDYPPLKGAGVWQMADIKNFVEMKCAVKNPSSGSAVRVAQFLDQLKNMMESELR